MTVCTTLNRIRKHAPCASGWETLLRSLDKTKPDDEPLPLTDILDSNGFDDAVWCLRSVRGHDKEIRLFNVEIAREVQHLMKDPRSVEALDVAERYAHGNATKEELENAYAAAYAASAAASAAARTADAADDAAAAYAAAYAAAHSAARAAAYAACQGEDTYDITCAVMHVTLTDVIQVLEMAYAPAYDLARKTQTEIFRRIFG
jgi:hypothetical protein